MSRERLFFSQHELDSCELVIPVELGLIAPDFEPRFRASLDRPPIAGVLHQQGRWMPWYSRLLQRGMRNCDREGICDHGFDHLCHVSYNALVLKDIALRALDSRESNGRQPFALLFDDSRLLFAVLVHDIGYGLRGTIFENQGAENHVKKGRRFMRILWQRFLASPIAFPITSDGDDFNKWQGLEGYLPYLLEAIGPDKGEIDQLINSLPGINTSAEDLFAPLVQLADKLDYFRARRVARVPEVTTYNDNPYYFLSKAVRGYRLVYIEEAGRVQFRVALDRAVAALRGNGEKSTDFNLWLHQTEEYNGKVWLLARVFMGCLGLEFEVVEEEKEGFDSFGKRGWS